MDMQDTRGQGSSATMTSGEGQGRQKPKGQSCSRERDFPMGLLLSVEEHRHVLLVA